MFSSLVTVILAFAPSGATADGFTRLFGVREVNISFNVQLSGDHGRGVPPVPIPNTVVKPSCADDTRIFLGK